jgi:hypothetical protein
MGPLGCPEILVINYHPVLRKISKELRSKVMYFEAAGYPNMSIEEYFPHKVRNTEAVWK